MPGTRDIYTSSEHVGHNPFQARAGAREYFIKRFRRDNGCDEYNRNFRTILGVGTAFGPWTPHKNDALKGSLEHSCMRKPGVKKL